MDDVKGLIVEIIKNNRDMGVIMGSVISASPLKIQVLGDEKLVLNERITLVPRELTDYTVAADISGGTVTGSTGSAGDPAHSHNLTALAGKEVQMLVKNGLKAGEIVYMLSYNHGKKYLVLGRA